MKTLTIKLFALLVVAMSVLTGCNNTSGAGHNERELRIALINPIDGMHNTVSQGIDSYFNATYIDQKTGQQVDVTEQVTWASSNPNTRIMNNGTLITQESATQSTVSASYLDAYESNRIEVAIIAPDNETLSFRVQPGVYHVNEQETLQYRAFVEFSYQGRVAHQDVTHGTRWSHNVTDGDNHVVICNIGSIEPECEGQQSGFTSTDLGEAVVEVIAEHPLITNQLLNQSNEWLFISENAPFSDFTVTVNNTDYIELYKKQTAQALASVYLVEEEGVEDVTELVYWHSSNSDIATVNSLGEITAHSAGTVSITASVSSQVNDSVKVEVLPYNIESISIEGPLEQTLPVDQRSKENYKVLAYYDDSQNNPINITTSVQLTSTDSHVARAFVETNSFYIKAGALIGSAEIQAHYEGFSSEIISVDVEPYEITGITLEGLNNVIEVNEVQEFQIHAQYNNGFNSYPLTASRLLLSYDGQESSPHLMYGSYGYTHGLMGLSTTDSDIDVRFYYLAPDSKTYETSSNIKVVTNSSKEAKTHEVAK